MDTEVSSVDSKTNGATSRPLPAENTDDVVIDCQINELYYGTLQGGSRHADSDQEKLDHRVHRAFGMRQEHGVALPQSHERSGPRLSL